MSPTLQAGSKQLFEKVGTYILPGRVRDPARGLAEAKDAERIGLGAIWISERYATKEPAVLSGAVSQLTERARITATMYVPLLNPSLTPTLCNPLPHLLANRVT